MAVVVPVISTFDARGIDRAIRDFRKLKTNSDKMAFGLLNADKAARSFVTTFAKVATVGLGVAAVMGKNLVDAASALEESQSKVNVVFGESARVVEDFAKTSATAAGISRQAALEAAGTYGNLFQAFGVGREQAAEMSVTLVQLASDLASFNNTSTEDALQALRSGLSGETEPLKRFGVALNDVRLKQEALNLGLYSGKGNLDVAAKAQAAYALILKDTSLAQGDFARTSEGAANQQRILAAQFQNVRAEIGTALLPIFKGLLTFINNSILPVLQEFSRILGEDGVGAAFAYLRDEFLNFTSNLGPTGSKIYTFIGIIAALRAAVIAFTIAVNLAKVANILFGLSLATTPIGLIAALIAGVVTGLAFLYMRFEAVRKIANPVINGMIAGFEMLVNAVIGLINSFISWGNVFNGVARFFGINVGNMEKIATVSFGRIGDEADKAVGKISRIADVAGAMRAKEGDIDKVRKAITNVDTSAGGAGKSVASFAEQVDKLVSSMRGLTRDQKALVQASKDAKQAQDSLANATEGVRIAQAQFNLVTRGYPADSKKAREATRALDEANRRLRDSTLGQEDAVRRVSEAERELARLRAVTANPENIAAAERDLQRSKFDVEEAAFRVLEAEQELADLRSQPGAAARDVRRAEIALEEAKFRVADSTIAVRDAEQKLNDERTRAATADELAAAERELEAAKRAVQDSIDSQREATIAQAEAQAFLNEILNGARAGSEAYTEALDELNEAKKQEQEAIDRVADALDRERDALLAVIEAQRELNKLKGQSPATVVAKAGQIIEQQGGIPLPSQTTSPTDYGLSGIDFFGGLSIVPFANGGIVTSPTLGLVGEAGPEAIIPLSRADNMGATINLTVNAGMGANGPDIGDAIVEALRRWQFRNGALVGAAQPLKVA